MCTMDLYKRTLQLLDDVQIDEGEICIDLPFSNSDNLTLPEFLSSQCKEPLNWTCKNVYYISDIHLGHQIKRRFPDHVTNTKIKSFIKEIVRNLFSDEFVASINERDHPIVIFGGDISTQFEVAKCFYTEFVRYWNQIETKPAYCTNHYKRYIYAILGNHELWDFKSLDECCLAYQNLFESLNICFLNNSIAWFGTHHFPRSIIAQSTPSIYYHEEVNKKGDPDGYDRQIHHIHNTIIVGGIGFAGYNNSFNADMGIYRGSLTRTQEIEQTKKWEDCYLDALDIAQKTNSILIVLTHNPIVDWMEDGHANSNCVYFSGHTHRNNLHHDEEANIHIFENNQIGYRNSSIRFKQAYIYNGSNPLAVLEDGYHEIRSSDYLKFYDYMQENISGNGLVERQLKNNDAHFYMVKHSGYYGFFLTSSKGSCICSGGRIKKIKEHHNIAQLDSIFLNMVNSYLKLLTPYRNAQEKIAREVRSFGGNGKIHGTIVDIDFYNHIMLNPLDSTVTYYYSPIFGQIKTYKNLLTLLSNHNKVLANEYRKRLNSASNNLPSRRQADTILETKTIEIDIENSIYAISRRISPLQRLFSAKILRDWNDDLLMYDEQESTHPLNIASATEINYSKEIH